MELNIELKPNNIGLTMLKSLIQQQQTVIRTKRELHSAQTAIRNIEHKITEWLVPDRAEPGQIFMLAVGKVFLKVEVKRDKEFKLSWDPHPPEDIH